LLKLNKLAKALADAEECVKLDPSYHKGWMRKAMVLESQGQLQQVRLLAHNTAVHAGTPASN
jgi:Tfp pilus assembly protein PilF